MSKLKPCPFCGKEPHYNVYASCTRHTSAFYEKDWNTRPIEDALQAKLDTYERLLSDAIASRDSYDNCADTLKAKLDMAVKALEDNKSRLLELRDEELVKDLSVFKSCAMRIYSDTDDALKELEDK